MTAAVQRLVEEVRALPQEDLDQFLAWLAQYQVEQMDDWDKQIERDSAPGGRLQAVLDRVRTDISAERTKPLNEVVNNS